MQNSECFSNTWRKKVFFEKRAKKPNNHLPKIQDPVGYALHAVFEPSRVEHNRMSFKFTILGKSSLEIFLELFQQLFSFTRFSVVRQQLPTDMKRLLKIRQLKIWSPFSFLGPNNELLNNELFLLEKFLIHPEIS